MKLDDFKKLVANGSKEFFRLNASVTNGNPVKATNMERSPSNAITPKDATKKADRGRFYVSITDCRHRTVDKDGVNPKWHIDQLRFTGFIPDDRPEVCDLNWKSVKIPKHEQEKIIIEVWKI